MKKRDPIGINHPNLNSINKDRQKYNLDIENYPNTNLINEDRQKYNLDNENLRSNCKHYMLPYLENDKINYSNLHKNGVIFKTLVEDDYYSYLNKPNMEEDKNYNNDIHYRKGIIEKCKLIFYIKN